MRNKLIFKIALSLMVVLLIIATCANFSYAANSNFNLEGFENKSNTKITNNTKEIVGAVLSIVRIVGTGVAIIIITVVAMKYIMSAPGERADIKKASFQYVIGAFILFGASNILTTLIGVIQSIFP